jgi:hypothetical protein
VVRVDGGVILNSSGWHFFQRNNFNPAALTTKLTLEVQQDLVASGHSRTCTNGYDSFEYVMPKCYAEGGVHS